PLVSARLEGRELVLSQQRFTYLPEPLPGSTPSPRNQLWQVPLQIRLVSSGRASTERRLLAGAEMRMPGPERLEFVLLNEGGHGSPRSSATACTQSSPSSAGRRAPERTS